MRCTSRVLSAMVAHAAAFGISPAPGSFDTMLCEMKQWPNRSAQNVMRSVAAVVSVATLSACGTIGDIHVAGGNIAA